MRKKYVAGNWKMNLDAAGAVSLASALAQQYGACSDKAVVDMAVCPPFVYLAAVKQALGDSGIALGAQDVFYEGNGAFTGEISVAMLKDVGCSFVLVGHSERRHVIGETNEILNKKTKAALAGGLDVIFCIGELLAEREANKTEVVLEEQLRQGLTGITAEQMAKITVAYEPVWAIGTGKTASTQQAQDAHFFCRGILADMFGKDVAAKVRIQYGGSVKPDNAAELMAQPDVDGALVGGAALKSADFMNIMQGGVTRGHGGCSCGCSCK